MNFKNTKNKIYSVSELNNLIKMKIESNFTDIWVSGEISNYKVYTSGHVYFSLKESDSQIGAVMFSSVAENMKFKLEDGVKVIVYGKISVYTKRGEYRVIVSYIEPAGWGELQIAFQKLKEKLEKEGLFDSTRKKAIPEFVNKVGIVTSPDGAAIHDILSIFERKKTQIYVLIFPVRVQGNEAKYDIVEAIKYLNENHKELDVLLVGRGGGSLEDLWPFNEEIVARAIADSKIPVISCVGHEIDFTIADFVSDMRAPTPTAAAEYIVRRREEIQERVKNLCIRLRNVMNFVINDAEGKISRLTASRFLRNPAIIIEERIQILDELSEKFINSIKRLSDIKMYDLKILSEKLNALSPLSILSRGYSIVRKFPDGKVVKSVEILNPGDTVNVKLNKGEFFSEVHEIKN